MAILDTSLGWHAGDAERIILALDLGIGEYTINEMVICCNKLGEIAEDLVHRVRDLLSEYDTAVQVERGLGIDADAGRTLVKADVLEWEKDKGGRYEATKREKGRIYNELAKIFAFCPIAPIRNGSTNASLIRS